MLRTSGLCETCDLIRVAGTREADEDRPRLFMQINDPPAGNGATAEQPQPRQKRKYTRRTGIIPEKPKQRRARKELAPALMTIEQLRGRYSDELAEVMLHVKALEVKLAVLDDVEAAIKSGK